MARRVLRIVLSGSVQGYGVRPALARIAAAHGWCGRVKNTTEGVDLILAGGLPPTDQLLSILRHSLPKEAGAVEFLRLEVSDFEGLGFDIESSDTVGPISTVIPCDVAICNECLAEVRDPNNRRYRHPLTSCARCGPRYSIILTMPFDRERTTLRSFPLCAECQCEYDDPADRRFHAQTIGCPNCGPQVWLTGGSSATTGTKDEAICRAAESLIAGGIVAVRGIGGYQLLADATSTAAVKKLRTRKRRPDKPFAILCRTIDDARRIAFVGDLEAAALTSHQNPVVLLRQLDATAIAADVNPRLREIGIMLPTTAMHDRLIEVADRPLVCTSGNIHDEPLVHDITQAQERLSGIADLFLHHNREVHQPVDDSVVRIAANRVMMVRCARGYAPMALRVPLKTAALAVGGHQKSAFAGFNGHQAWLGPHIANLNTIAAQQEWHHRFQQFAELIGVPLDPPRRRAMDREDVAPEAGCSLKKLACDSHPDYFSTRFSKEFYGSPASVWHHHAHVIAAMIEHRMLTETVVGVAFDGSGLGPDGTIWGGEFLIASVSGFERFGHLRRFGLPGGEGAIKDVRRLAVSLLTQLDSFSPEEIAQLTRLTRIEVLRLQKVLCLSQTPSTSSAGRLFDAVASLVLAFDCPSYDGQPAMLLEAVCDPSECGFYNMSLNNENGLEVDWRPLLKELVEDLSSRKPASMMATRFHRGLSQAIISVCERTADLPVLLCGGVFQNRLLVELIANAWPGEGRRLKLPGSIPVNDGGLAAGQLVAVAGSIE